LFYVLIIKKLNELQLNCFLASILTKMLPGKQLSLTLHPFFPAPGAGTPSGSFGHAAGLSESHP
jgi:hypothetical protein